MQGFIHSSGGLPLNFKIVGGTAEPASPKENTIWINTDQKITSWIFSATEPEDPVEGMVWISVGTDSTVAFSATKKNPVMVYPLSAKQYISGVWVDVVAKSYQGGKWVDWAIMDIIVDGIINEEIGFSTNVIDSTKNDPLFSQGDGFFTLTTQSGYAFCRCTDEKLNLTNVKKIELDVNALTAHKHNVQDLLSGVSLVVLTSNQSTSTTSDVVNLFVAQAQTKTTGRQTLTIDNSEGGLSGEYYIGITVGSYGSSGVGKANVYSLKMST